MAHEKFIERNFKPDSLWLIQQCAETIERFEAQGYTLTLRQLYYQMVAGALIENTVRSYKRLGSIINDARLAGLIDWDSIEDRTRNLEKPSTWDSPAHIVEACAQQFRFDLWEDQEHYVEVWVEKEALAGVIEKACREHRVPWLSCRGFLSQSEAYAAGKRFQRKADDEGKVCHILHLGDHDPSGLDMTRDNDERVFQLSNGVEVNVHRLALNMDQITRYRPPPNPAKETDARFVGYAARFGTKSWELDALKPQVIEKLIQDKLLELLDLDLWQQSQEREERARAKLFETAERLRYEENNE